ncbi:MAG: acyltransferase family protein [Pseudomonadota bacterium]
MTEAILTDAAEIPRVAPATRARAEAHALRLDIQGLRAIAVLGVVAYHANARLLSGGYVGVDIFFVISGYLIAGILLKEMESGRYTLAGFYERRVRRLFPALFAMLAVTAAVTAFVLPPHALKEFAHTAASTILFVSNADFLSMSGYFDSDSHQRPLLHTWSLAVEEQFYLLFPLVLFAIVKVWRKSLRVVLTAGILVSLAAAYWMLKRNPSAAFYLSPFRADELLIGAVLAGLTFPKALPRWVRHGVSLIGLALIGYSLVFYTDDTLFPGLAALPPCIGTALVLFAGAGAGENSLGGALISAQPLTGFGAISYSLYLWHWPVLVLGRAVLMGEPTPAQTAGRIALAIAAATISYWVIERPFIKRRGGPVLRYGALAMAAGFGVCALAINSDGFPQRFGPAALTQFSAAEDFSPRRSVCHNLLARVRPYGAACVFGDPAATPHMAVWSDSHGAELAVALGERLAERGQSLVAFTASSCPPAIGFAAGEQPKCEPQNAETYRGLINDPRIGAVVFAVNFMAYRDSEWPALSAGLSRAIESVAASGRHVVIVLPTPVFAYDPPSAMGVLAQHGADPRAFHIARNAFAQMTARGAALLRREAGRVHADLVDPAEMLCDSQNCYAYRADRGALYFNRDHLSMAGARIVAAQFPFSDDDSARAIARGRGRVPPAVGVGRVRRA